MVFHGSLWFYQITFHSNLPLDAVFQKPHTSADSPDIAEVVCSNCKASQCLFETSKCRNKDSTEKTITLRFEKNKDQHTKKTSFQWDNY